MNDGATAEVIESKPIARAKAHGSHHNDARRQAGTERRGPSRRNGVRTRTRSDTRPRMTAAIPAAREKRANNNPSSKEALVNRNEPRGVAAEMRPSTPPWPENASAVRRPTRFKSNEKTRASLDWASQRTKRRLAATATPPSPKTSR